jgi:hypothetical protein
MRSISDWRENSTPAARLPSNTTRCTRLAPPAPRRLSVPRRPIAEGATVIVAQPASAIGGGLAHYGRGWVLPRPLRWSKRDSCARSAAAHDL